MTIQQFIEKAAEGGVTTFSVASVPWCMSQIEQGTAMGRCLVSRVLLDPEAWKAVGKVEGWEYCGGCKYDKNHEGFCTDDMREDWLPKMHAMIDALAEGKTIEQYLETL